MSHFITPTNVKYFASCLFNTQKMDLNKVIEIMTDFLGEGEVFNPSFNPLVDYYEKEMGAPLERFIFYQDSLRQREELVDLKIKSTLIEREFSKDNKRSLNIDVGYVAKEQVLLATGKPYSHRIFLGQGVFAELTYFFTEKSFQTLPWTYPDYAHEEKILFFNSIR